MALAFDGTGYLHCSTRPVSGFPFSKLIWTSWNGTGSDHQMWFNQCQSNADRYVGAFFVDTHTDIRAVVRNPGDSFFANRNSGTQPNNSAMHLWVGVFTSATSRRIWYAGTAPEADTSTCTDDITNHDRVVVGATYYNSGSAQQFTRGSLAEAHFFNVALDATAVGLLAAGAKPEETSGWVDGWTLESTSGLVSLGGTRTLTLVGGVTNSGFTHPVSRSGGGSSSLLLPSRQISQAAGRASYY